MKHNGLSVAVVGHANAGKTSLIRTLLRNPDFGEVADQAGTTRHVEGGVVSIDGSADLTLFDTPGLEDSISLFAILDGYFKGRSVDGIERLHYFLAHLTDYPELEQEAKVLRALLTNDLIFYVIDLREPILGKYRDELQILSYAAKPIIPVLNFTRAGHDNIGLWKQQLARLNFHAYVSFDNVNFQFSDELKIYQKMQTLLADKEKVLQSLIEQRQQQWFERFAHAKQMVADLFIDCACARFKTQDSAEAIEQTTTKLQDKVRQLEAGCVKQLLSLYQFRQQDLSNNELPIKHGQWELDLFSAENLQEFGIKLTGNIAKGAGLGVTIDLVTGGMTLGAAALTGGIAGALWGVKQRYFDEIEAKITGARYICLNEQTMQVLWLRQLKLLELLQRRGHASVSKIDYQVSHSDNQLPKSWGKWLRQLRNNPNWSRLNNKNSELDDPKRESLLAEVCEFMVDNSGD
ncbi:GTPase/DUF3482 domain-containing protein [Psychromonas sp.]|uniref:GTPase/DUF3482 domain-containing protein n=1 Tax=Psychromonas sp. TaxID=1884585 RepID=UPI00356992DD